MNKRKAVNLGKQGTTGQAIDLIANYYPVAVTGKGPNPRDFTIYIYALTFTPNIDSIFAKKRMIASLPKIFGLNICVGNMMYKLEKLAAEVTVSAEYEGQKYTINTSYTGYKTNTDIAILQVFGTVLRKCMALMNLTLIGRNFFDTRTPSRQSVTGGFKLQIIPGFFTSIRQHEDNILLCAGKRYQ